MGFELGADLGGVVSTGIGMIGERKRYERNLKGQEHLMGVQLGNQQQLNQQGHDLQYDMWQKTNYPAQVEMLRKAGLNPALMYGMSGGGGATTGSQGGGSAQGGSPPAQQPVNMQDMLIGAELELKKAQKNNVDADTELKGATTKNLGKEYEVKMEQLREMKRNNDIGDITFDWKVNKVKWEYMNEMLDHELREEKINLTKEQRNKVEHEIWQGWAKVGFDAVDSILGFMNLKNWKLLGENLKKNRDVTNGSRGGS
jgi:hypothetical protein